MLLWGWVTCGPSGAAQADPATARFVPFSAAPSDVVAAYYNACSGDPGALQRFLAATSLLSEAARQTGMLSNLDPATMFWIDMAASIPIVLQQPHTISLMSIAARPRPGQGHRLSSLQLGIVLDTNGKNDALKYRIRQLLLAHTNSDDTQLIEETSAGSKRYTIHDRRLPPWASVSWGVVGERYIIAMGEGAFEKLAKTVLGDRPNLASDPWAKRALADLAPLRTAINLYLDFDRFRPQDDPALAEKIQRVQRSLRIPGVSKCLFWLRHVGRSVDIEGVVQRNGADRTHAIAHSRFLSALHGPAVPDAATGYAVFACNPSALLDTISTGYLTARSPKARARAIQYWKDVQQQAGVDVAEDLVSYLGRYVVVHNYPEHALRLPVALTIVLPLTGDAKALRRNVDKLMRFVQAELGEGGAVSLRRADDGVWFLDIGIHGPALAVVDGWLIVSFSPQAVRENATFLAPER
ncbi:MAG: hypothetical protein ACE5E5_06115 [Phycisphaerae bacterium]